MRPQRFVFGQDRFIHRVIARLDFSGGVVLTARTDHWIIGIVVAVLAFAWAEIPGHLMLVPTLADWLRTRRDKAGQPRKGRR